MDTFGQCKTRRCYIALATCRQFAIKWRLDEVQLLENGLWNEEDQEYTDTQGSISAVWPTLRHGQYTWAVIPSNSPDYLSGMRYPCDHPSRVACGRTENEYINVKDLPLSHGNRYHVCIHANRTTNQYKTWTERLPEISACSDGIILDTVAPVPGEVRIESIEDIVYQDFQTSSSEVGISWDYFTDVESELSVHYTGVAFYEVAIGTLPGKDDIVSYRNVGFTNRTVLAHLDLKSGIPLYATIKGTDFVGLSSTSSSSSFIIDETAPDTDPTRSILTEGAFFRSASTIVASWDGIFWDNESGILHYEWAIGSQAGYSDVKTFATTDNTYLPSENLDLELIEGHPYFITIKAINTAGLTSSRSFGAFRVDTTPPIKGHVYDSSDIHNATRNRDYDWVTEMTSLCASWEGFHDPHSSLVGYTWKIGLCNGCSDMLSEQFLGLSNDVCTSHIDVVPGSTYYVTVTACNAAGLCTSVSSDGIAVDTTPPAVGKVHDGNYEEDIQFTAIRNIMYAKWWGFHDPESKITRYEWRAGTSPYASNIIAATPVHQSEFAMVTLNDPLPHNTAIYVTVRAINHAGLWAEGTSNGFVVDDTGPSLLRNVTRNTALGVASEDYQVVRDVVDISWEFKDNESGIKRQHVYLKTHYGGDIAVNSVEIGSSDTHYILTNLSLHDGSRYTVQIIACNGADVCSMTQTHEFWVDSSGPTMGTFATDSEQPNSNWMTWSYNSTYNTSILHLAWFGFSDLHSGLSHYFLTVGTNYDSTDLLQISPLRIEHIDNEETQNVSVHLSQDIMNIQRVYVSVWAVNKAGLRSQRVHQAFDVAYSGWINEGALVLHRHCESHSCEGHCVCAPANQRCPSESNNTCTDVSQDNQNEEISVIDTINASIQTDSTLEDVDFTPSITMLSAVWYTTLDQGLPILRYEWSVGLDWSEKGIPQGVYDPATEQVWHDIGTDTHVIITFDEGNRLTPGDTYVVFVRAWYNDRTYATFQSDGVTPYPFSPKASGLMGAHVKEIVAGDSSLHDVDFITDVNSLTISWSGVFIQDPGALDYFELAVGTSGGEQLKRFVDNRIQKTETQIHFANLDLEPGKRYYATIHAFNKAGVYSSVSSDGVIVDTESPKSGVVFDGKGLHDMDYQSTVSTVSASWYGFYDLDSYIDHYVWCVGNTNIASECSILPRTNVGVYLAVDRELQIPLLIGQRYYSKVFAVDAAGHQSEIIVSNGFVVDTTPPIPISKSISGDNLLYDPSFEEESTDNIQSNSWAFTPTNSGHIVRVGRKASMDGESIAVVYNKIRQRVPTIPRSHYILTFYTNHVSNNENIYLHQEGTVEAPGLKEVFRIYDRLNNGGIENAWQKNIFYFIAEQTMSTISISSHGDHGLYLDLVSLRIIQFDDKLNDINHAVSVDLQTHHGKSSLHANWQFVDEESPIEDYQWAIGTVIGGTQLQEFTSVGRRSYAINTDLILIHVPQIFVTVVAKNKANLVGVAYSDGIAVDFTPPDILYVREETEFQEDADFTSDGIFNISWEVQDIETGISFCEWSIGYKPNSEEIESHTRILNVVNANFKYHLQVNRSDERKVFVNILCQNNAGLSSHTSSNGIIMVTTTPDASRAFVDIIATSETEYPLQDGYQSNTTFIKASWMGFEDSFGIHHYQCKISGPTIDNSEWQHCGTTSSTSAVFRGLNFSPGSAYRVDVRAVNYANLVGDSVGSNVTVLSDAPKLTGIPILPKWSENNTLTVSWINTFSDVKLWYEISIGSILGGSDVMQWVETTNTQITISDLDKVKDYHLTLTAINNIGLSNTINFVLKV